MAPKKHPPPLIRSEAFIGTDDLTWNDLEALRVGNRNEAADKLISNWSGGLVGMTFFILSNDSRKVSDVEFGLVGQLYEDAPKAISTNKFFPGSNAKLVLQDLDMAVFKFRNSLSSNIVDCSELNYSYKQHLQGPDLTPDAARDLGLGGFSLRAHILPTLENYAKVELVCFPLPAEALLDQHPLAKDPRFPGIQLTAVGQIIIEPGQGDIIGERSWGQPTLPAMIRATPFTSNSPLPPSSLLRQAFGALFCSASKPTLKQNCKFLLEQWALIQTEGVEALKTLPLDVAWPPPQAAFPQQGRHNFYSPSFLLVIWFVLRFLNFCFDFLSSFKVLLS